MGGWQQPHVTHERRLSRALRTYRVYRQEVRMVAPRGEYVLSLRLEVGKLCLLESRPTHHVGASRSSHCQRAGVSSSRWLRMLGHHGGIRAWCPAQTLGVK